MGVPRIGGDLTGDIDEGDISITGDLDDIGLLTGNADDVFSITSGASFGTVTIDSATGTWSYALDNGNPTVTALNPGDTLTDIFTVNMLDTAGQGAGQNDAADVTITINGIICFCAGTLIETTDGPHKVETLAVGDRVVTMDGPAQPIRWIGRREISREMAAANPKLNPVRITAGSLGAGLPKRDLLVSRQHRMLVRSKIAERMFSASEVLIPAIKLTEFPGIFVDKNAGEVQYYHVLCDNHEILFAEGAPTESMLAGDEVLKTLCPDAQEEIETLFPDANTMPSIASSARLIPSGNRQKKLIARHLKQSRNILSFKRDTIVTACGGENSGSRKICLSE